MLTAEQRAHIVVSQHFNNGDMASMMEAIILSFKEHARDQRHLCAENILSLQDDVEHEGDCVHDASTITSAHQLVMNTKAPGK